MTNEQKLEHRLAMILDDVKALVEFLDENRLMEALDKPSKETESAWTHISNIEIACDLNDDDCLGWKLYTKPKFKIGDSVSFTDDKTQQFDVFQVDNILTNGNIVLHKLEGVFSPDLFTIVHTY
jgi:hypothetical protein